MLCDAQLDDEDTGEGLEVTQDIKDKLEFKLIEDPRLQGVSNTEARKYVIYFTVLARCRT